MKNISSVISDVVRERMENAFLGNFIISWVLVNHALILRFIFGGEDIDKKIDKLESWVVNPLTDILCPVFLVIAYLYVIPLIDVALLSIKLKIIEPFLSKYKNREQILVLDAKLEIEDKRLDLFFREKNREVAIEKEKAEWQRLQSESAEDEASASKIRLESEKKEAEFAAAKLKDLEKSVKIENILSRENAIDDLERDLRERQQLFEDGLNELKYLRKSAQWMVLDKEADIGDRVTVDFQGSVNGEALEGGKAEYYPVKIGEGRMVPGFEEGLLGHRSGDKFSISVKLADNFHTESLKGKSAQFDISIHKIESLMAPVSGQKINTLGNFEVYTNNQGEFRFRFTANKGQNILASEGYATKISCLNGVESVINHSLDESNYERRETKDGKYYFNLKDGDNQVIAASRSYESAGSRDNGIELVRNYAPYAKVTDISDG